jgi:hypothetical protein
MVCSPIEGLVSWAVVTKFLNAALPSKDSFDKFDAGSSDVLQLSHINLFYKDHHPSAWP